MCVLSFIFLIFCFYSLNFDVLRPQDLFKALVELCLFNYWCLIFYLTIWNDVLNTASRKENFVTFLPPDSQLCVQVEAIIGKNDEAILNFEKVIRNFSTTMIMINCICPSTTYYFYRHDQLIHML